MGNQTSTSEPQEQGYLPPWSGPPPRAQTPQPVPDDQVVYATNTKQEVSPRAVESAKGGPGDWPAKTLHQVFTETVEKWGNNKALAAKRVPPGGKSKDTPWTYQTYQEYYDISASFARALIFLGFEPHGVINILGFNAPEWFQAFMGAMMAGGVAAGIYITNGPEAAQYITQHSEAEVVVVDDVAQLKKYASATKEKIPKLKALVIYGKPAPTDIKFAHTGLKAVMLSHDNLTWVGKMAEYKFPDRRETDCLISYLPLSHVAAQIIDLMIPLGCGGHVYFAQPDALKGSLIHTLREVRPQVFFAVPRVWEKMYESMQDARKSMPLPLRMLSDTLKKTMKAHILSTQFGEGPVKLPLLPIAEKMFGKVKEKLGMDRVRYAATGAAPLSEEIQAYFASIGITIFEVFGQSESTGLATANCPVAWKLGTVGRIYPGQECRIDPECGEYQYRGRGIFMGYMKMEEETKATILPGGWLRSGDIAKIDADHEPLTLMPSGFVRITGRIKELIITAGGENIPPVLIENEIKATLPAVASCMVVGDQRKYLTVLLTLHSDEKGNLIALSKEAGDSMGSSTKTVQEVKSDATWKKFLEDGIKKTNAQATSRAQYVQKFTILDQDFSEKEGDLTPTLKLKRSVVAKKHQALIEKMYAGSQ